jgi:hypothetical protein
MKRIWVMALLTTVALTAAIALSAGAATKYNPCSLLTTAQLEAVLRAKVGVTAEKDTTIPEGTFKGDIMSTCDWAVGSTYVTLNVIRGPRTPQEQAAGLAGLRAAEEKLKKQGWTVEPANIPGAECVSVKPPASESSALPGASCVMVSKGLAFWLGVNGSVTVQQVKSLADMVAARLP